MGSLQAYLIGSQIQNGKASEVVNWIEAAKWLGGWFILAVILAIGLGRWWKYQREMDERDERIGTDSSTSKSSGNPNPH